MVDVGSLDGSDALYFARAGGHRVWTFEPSPSKLDLIRHRIAQARAAGSVTLHGVALSNETGSASFRMTRPVRNELKLTAGQHFGSAQDSLTSSAAAPAGAGTGAREKVVRVPVTTLDSFDTNVSLLYLKVDAQGYDYRVLRGAENLLRSHRVRALAFEFFPHAMPHGRAEALEALRWLVHGMRYSCAPCNLNRWRVAKADERKSIPTYVRLLSGAGNKSSTLAFFDDIACEPRELCEEARRPDCHLWQGHL